MNGAVNVYYLVVFHFELFQKGKKIFFQSKKKLKEHFFRKEDNENSMIQFAR